MAEQSLVKLKKLTKRNFVTYAIIAFALVGMALGLFFLSQSSKNVVGVQLITSKGTLLIGRNKYNKRLSAWVSPMVGWFEKDGNPNFFYIKHKKDKASDKNWEIVWEWDELYKVGQKEPLIKFIPPQEEKDASIETLSALCANKKEASLSCQWNISNKIFIESLTKEYACVSDLSSEFYGGAHPIALRRFGSFELKQKKFMRLDDFISSSTVKDQLWTQLYSNIKGVLDQSLFNETASGLPNVDPLTEQNDNPNEKLGLQASPEQRLTALLNGQGYTFSPNVFCPIIRPEGPFLLFGFPHSEQVNRGLNFKAEALLNQPKLPKKVLRLFNDYRFTKAERDESTQMLSPDSKWKLGQRLNEVDVKTNKKKLTVILPEPEDSAEDLLGIFWIYRSPSLTTLEKFKFKELKLSKSQANIELGKYL